MSTLDQVCSLPGLVKLFGQSLKQRSIEAGGIFLLKDFRPPSEKCVKLKRMYIHKNRSARTVYWRTQARGKRKYIMRLETRHFFLEIGLSG